MKQWKNFLAICVKRDGSILVIPSKKSVYWLIGKKFDRIILGPRAHDAGAGVKRAIEMALESNGDLVTWVKDEAVDMAGGIGPRKEGRRK